MVNKEWKAIITKTMKGTEEGMGIIFENRELVG